MAWVSKGRDEVVLVVDLGGWGAAEELGGIGPMARVGNTASTSNFSISTVGDVSTGAVLLLSASSFCAYRQYAGCQ
ncbi:hypothetical protein H5410_002576 [Solanum commersonii]|uniref:Uncharacterized protein n=1 Tax=Solanum commersonii TaxID=4109 RepID=A0A9J6B2M8_SOLCO|nr:hypothetical protein H5410_002576 [Solanum commersonii]